MDKTVLIIGAFDTKGVEYAFLHEQIISKGLSVLTVNVGVLGSTDLFGIDVEVDEVAKAGGGDIESLRATKDRGHAMKVMTAGAAAISQSLYQQGKFDGIIGMGGTGGTTVVTSAMRVLPVGLPKVCVSTAASGDTSAYVGTKDVTMIPSIVDVAGVNRISRIIFTRAAGAICGMVTAEPPESADDKPIIAASMFGNTTECVNACAKDLSKKGYEVLIFHATGTGGKTMESLVDQGLVGLDPVYICNTVMIGESVELRNCNIQDDPFTQPQFPAEFSPCRQKCTISYKVTGQAPSIKLKIVLANKVNSYRPVLEPVIEIS